MIKVIEFFGGRTWQLENEQDKVIGMGLSKALAVYGDKPTRKNKTRLKRAWIKFESRMEGDKLAMSAGIARSEIFG